MNHYSKICNKWGYTPTNPEESGYESVIPKLKELSPDIWKMADESDKKLIESEIFDIYKKVNVIPITYWSLEGCIQEIKHVASRSSSIKNKIISKSNVGQSLCRFWFPNMQDAYTYHDHKIGLIDKFLNDVKLHRAIEICLKYKKSVLPPDLRSALSLVGGNVIQNFKPMTARAIYEYICPTLFGNILDFSSGYGGRMLGTMTSPFKYHYTGIEPNTETYLGLESFGELINQAVGTNYKIVNTVSEEFVPENNYYDAAFSSPPYFNLEIYCDEPTQCMHRYKSIDRWFDSYVEPTLKMLHKALIPNSLYAVNIADYTIEKNKFEIVDRWLTLSKKCNFEHIDTLFMPLQSRPGSKTSQKKECVYIFRKIN